MLLFAILIGEGWPPKYGGEVEPWWRGHEVEVDRQKILVKTLHDILGQFLHPPARHLDLALKIPF